METDKKPYLFILNEIFRSTKSFEYQLTPLKSIFILKQTHTHTHRILIIIFGCQMHVPLFLFLELIMILSVRLLLIVPQFVASNVNKFKFESYNIVKWLLFALLLPDNDANCILSNEKCLSCLSFRWRWKKKGRSEVSCSLETSTTIWKLFEKFGELRIGNWIKEKFSKSFCPLDFWLWS